MLQLDWNNHPPLLQLLLDHGAAVGEAKIALPGDWPVLSMIQAAANPPGGNETARSPGAAGTAPQELKSVRFCLLARVEMDGSPRLPRCFGPLRTCLTPRLRFGGAAHTLLLLQEATSSMSKTVLTGVNITINPTIIQRTKVTQLVAFKGGTAVAVFNLTTTTEVKAKLLRDLSAIAASPAALFDLIWEPTSGTSGTLKVKLEASYNAAGSSPSVSFLIP